MAARPPVKINGIVLSPQAIAEEAQNHPARTPAAAYQAAARALVIRALLLDEADRRAIDADPQFVANGKRETEDESRIRALIETAVPAREPAEAECRALYEADPGRFRSPDLFEASHILFTSSPRDQAAYASAFAQAVAAISELQAAPHLFETIARERSGCESRANGGRLGQTPRGELAPEIEMALDGLEEGELSPAPVKSRFGVHVLRLDRRAAGAALPFEYVHSRIAAYLSERNWRRDVARYIDGLIARASIEGVDMAAQARAA